MNKTKLSVAFFALLFVLVLPAIIWLSLCSAPASAQTQQAVKSKQPLRVLYVSGRAIGYVSGKLSSTTWAKDREGWEREIGIRVADFTQFLQANFSSVKTCKDSEFTPELAKDADVIIVDGDIADRLPTDFPVPLVLIGLNADPIQIPESRGSKLRFV